MTTISPRGRRPTTAGVLVLVVSLLLFGTLSVIAYRLHRHNEHRLLDLQVKQTATVLQALLPGVETPLASGAEIAATSGGSAAVFRDYMDGYVGPKATFSGAALWRVDGTTTRLVTSVGKLGASAPPGAGGIAHAAGQLRSVRLIGPLGVAETQPRIGYLYAVGRQTTYVVYAESLLPPRRHAGIQPGSPFSDLRFALYLGPTPTPARLLQTNSATLPVSGDKAMVTVAFGSSALTLVASSTVTLSGGLSKSLWWVVAIAGALISLLAGLAADRLARRRRAAEHLTRQTQQLLAQQTTIAGALQQAMLPETLRSPPGVHADARYLPGAVGVDIGGDWYDVLPLADRRLFFVIGDVSGRGLSAGTTMAALRFAVHAFVSEGHPPNVVLERLARMLDVERDGQFATILCGVLDLGRREVTIANAGHLPPLLVTDESSEYLDVAAGPPVGVVRDATYRSMIVPMPPAALLLAFTDGLVERRTESLDDSLARLRVLVAPGAQLADVLDNVVPGLAAESKDDIAILGVQWPV